MSTAFLRCLAGAALIACAVVTPHPAYAELATARATCEDEERKPEERIAACTRVIDDKASKIDERADALVSRGGLIDDLGRHDEAIADLSAALALVPNDPAALILRGNAYDAKGLKKEALADYDEAIRINPGDASGYFNRATILEEMGERTRAMADYRKALQIDPSFEKAKTNLAALQKK